MKAATTIFWPVGDDSTKSVALQATVALIEYKLSKLDQLFAIVSQYYRFSDNYLYWLFTSCLLWL